MRVVKKGNVYRKAGWFREHEKEIFTLLCIAAGFAVFVMAEVIRG